MATSPTGSALPTKSALLKGSALALPGHAVLTELTPVPSATSTGTWPRRKYGSPHQFVSWATGRNFDGPLGGEPWAADQTSLPPAVQDALVANLLTEDNPPS